jgi:hypothetical protein
LTQVIKAHKHTDKIASGEMNDESCGGGSNGVHAGAAMVVVAYVVPFDRPPGLIHLKINYKIRIAGKKGLMSAIGRLRVVEINTAFFVQEEDR